MALSVGVFQRPVEYKLNCLEMVYEFSGLELEYYYPTRCGFLLNFRFLMTYAGTAKLNICFYNGERLEVVIKVVYDVNSVTTTTIDYSQCSAYKFNEAKSVYANSYNNKIEFYNSMIYWLKEELRNL